MKYFWVLSLIMAFTLSCNNSNNKVKAKKLAKEESERIYIENIPDSLITGRWRLRSMSYAKLKYKPGMSLSYHRAFHLKYRDDFYLTLNHNKSVYFMDNNVGSWNQVNRTIKFDLEGDFTDFPIPESAYKIKRTQYLLMLTRKEGDFEYKYVFIGAD